MVPLMLRRPVTSGDLAAATKLAQWVEYLTSIVSPAGQTAVVFDPPSTRQANEPRIQPPDHANRQMPSSQQPACVFITSFPPYTREGGDLIDAHSFLPGNALDYAPSPAGCRRPATHAVRSPGSCYAGRLPQGAIKQIHDIRLPPGDNVPRLADAHTMAGFMLPWLPLVLLCWRRRAGAPVQCPEGDSECARFCPVGLVALHGGARGAWMTYQAFSENATGANAGTKGTI